MVGVLAVLGMWGSRRAAYLVVEKLEKIPMSDSFVASVRDGSREDGAACTRRVLAKKRSSGIGQNILED